MKKFLSLTLVLCLALTAVCSAFAAAVVSQPAVYNPDDGYTAKVDAENGITEDSITFTYYLDDLYKTSEIAALQAGDTVNAWGEAYTVETVEVTKDEDDVIGYSINGGFIDSGLSFGITETDAELCYCLGYDDSCARSEAGTLTLPMADEVIVSTYVMNDGAFNGDMETATMPAAQVKGYLLDKANTGDDNAISLDADFTIFVENDKIVEIQVNWAPNV